MTAWSELGTDFLTEGTWAIGQGPDAPDRQLLRALLRALDDGGLLGPELLEVGVGSGIDLRALANEGLLGRISYTGYDFTPEFIEHLRESYAGRSADFLVRDVLEMDDDGVADVVWCRHVLEHVADGELALRNLWRATRSVLLVSWFIRPTWCEAEVACRESDGFLHWTYSARRMVALARELGASLYRFDIDHHLNRASVWLLSRGPRPDLAEEAHRFLASDEFARAAIPVPPAAREREGQLREVLDDAAASIDDLTPAATASPAVVWRAQRVAARCAAAVGETALDRCDRVVLWGFRSSLDSMRHIFRHFESALARLGKETVRLDDAAGSLAELQDGDLVLAVDVEGHELRPVSGVDYVLHNFEASHPVWDGLDDRRLLRLQVYTTDADAYGVAWAPARRYDREARTLFQPWGTNLLADAFLPPVFRGDSTEAAFVGAVWDDGGLGNADAIAELRAALDERGLVLRHLTQVPDAENVAAVRASRIAPAVAGRWQVERGYLPCRVFKNVSYGALAVANVPKLLEVFAGCLHEADTIGGLLDAVLALGEEDYLAVVRAQQAVAADYTYRESLRAIGRALEEGR